MKQQPFHWEIRDILTQFVTALDGAIVKRYDNNRVAQEQVGVRYIFGPKERVMHDIVNANQQLTVPAVSIDVSSIARDSSRVFNKNASFFINSAKSGNRSILPTLTPQPVKITVNVSIMTRYQVDIEQIISNFVPFFTPYIELATLVPESVTGGAQLEQRTKVTWNETVSIATPTNLAYSDKFARVGDTSFTIDTWLYREQQDPVSTIAFVNANFYAVNERIFDADYQSLSAMNFSLSAYPDSNSTDFISISGYPQFTNLFVDTVGQLLPVDDTVIVGRDAGKSFLIYGKGFNDLTYVLLSSNEPTMYSNLTSINTSHYGAVSGFILEPQFYNVLNQNMVQITLPSLSASGTIDIIASNPVGWSTTFDIDQDHIDIV